MTRVLALLVALATVCIKDGGSQETPAEFLTRYNSERLRSLVVLYEANWAEETNITEENQANYMNAVVKEARLSKTMEKEASDLLNNPAHNSTLTPDQKRQLQAIIRDLGAAAQTDEEKLVKLTKLKSDMSAIYSKAKVCLDSQDKCLYLEPGLTHVLSKSRDCQRLAAAWKGWRDQSGRKMKDLYAQYVSLSNEAVKKIGYADMSEYWKSFYESPTFESDVAELLEQIKPLYQHLHAYVRRKLKAVYGPEVFPSSGHIPAHLLGNMWAQDWDNIGDLVKPFKNKGSVDVTEELKNQNYSVRRMFETSEAFFYSLGFDNMTEVFWQKSMLEKPSDGRDVVCHASAWDMGAKDDYRIKMCTTIDHDNLITIHHEMGHIQYYMQYKNQPLVYRDGANPGFHEAVGDTMSLSVQTPEHLESIGLLKNIDAADEEADINFLMHMALDKIAFLPFGYLIDQWRWAVFSGATPPEKYNSEWWKLRCKLQGISPPMKRSENDFDPGAKYHVPASVPYIRYFVSYIIQFQFYKAACEAANYTGPLHRCDFYNNLEAGERIRSMLRLGSSKPWPDAMEQITGQRKMDVGAVVEYFRPLLRFLEKENGQDLGWEESCPLDPPQCVSGAPQRQGGNLYIIVLLHLAVAVAMVTGRLR